ncbi:MAG: hypothetical protein JO337_02210 [Acidimicrobiales bacterium]|nr:hypothetical protein [Acidimicrobiales bacterium]
MSEDLLSGPEPGPDELRAIVSRASRRRWRSVGAAAAVALAVGGGVGYAVSNHSGGAQTVVAGSPSSGTTVPRAGALAPQISGNSGGGAGTSNGGISAPYASTMTRLFVRDAGTVSIRGYLTNFPSAVPESSCLGFPRFEAEVSTKNAVGQVSSGFTNQSSSDPIGSAQAQVVGVAEHDPVDVVVVDTSSAVKDLKMTFSQGGSDEMAPVQGWGVLAVELPASATANPVQWGSVGTLQALSAGGQVLQTITVNTGSNAAIPPATGCFCPPIAGSSSSAGAATGAPAIICAQPATPETTTPATSLPAQPEPTANGSAG